MSRDELDRLAQSDHDSRERYRSKVARHKANKMKETYMTTDLVSLLTQFAREGECYGGRYRDFKARPTQLVMRYNCVMKRRIGGKHKPIKCGITLTVIRDKGDGFYDITKRGTLTHDPLGGAEMSERFTETIRTLRHIVRAMFGDEEKEDEAGELMRMRNDDEEPDEGNDPSEFELPSKRRRDDEDSDERGPSGECGSRNKKAKTAAVSLYVRSRSREGQGRSSHMLAAAASFRRDTRLTYLAGELTSAAHDGENVGERGVLGNESTINALTAQEFNSTREARHTHEGREELMKLDEPRKTSNPLSSQVGDAVGEGDIRGEGIDQPPDSSLADDVGLADNRDAGRLSGRNDEGHSPIEVHEHWRTQHFSSNDGVHGNAHGIQGIPVGDMSGTSPPCANSQRHAPSRSQRHSPLDRNDASPTTSFPDALYIDDGTLDDGLGEGLINALRAYASRSHVGLNVGEFPSHVKATGEEFGYFLRVRNFRYFSSNGAYPQLISLECKYIRQGARCPFKLTFHGRFRPDEGSNVTSASTERTGAVRAQRQDSQLFYHCCVHVAHHTHSHPIARELFVDICIST